MEYEQDLALDCNDEKKKREAKRRTQRKPRDKDGVRAYILNWFLDDTDEQDADFRLFLLIDFIAALTLFMQNRIDSPNDVKYGEFISLRKQEEEIKACRQVLTTASLTVFPNINNPEVTCDTEKFQKQLGLITREPYWHYLKNEYDSDDFYNITETMDGVCAILSFLGRSNEYIDPSYSHVLVHVMHKLMNVCSHKSRTSWK